MQTGARRRQAKEALKGGVKSRTCCNAKASPLARQGAFNYIFVRYEDNR
jgi:hypothetical protein